MRSSGRFEGPLVNVGDHIVNTGGPLTNTDGLLADGPDCPRPSIRLVDIGGLLEKPFGWHVGPISDSGVPLVDTGGPLVDARVQLADSETGDALNNTGNYLADTCCHSHDAGDPLADIRGHLAYTEVRRTSGRYKTEH